MAQINNYPPPPGPLAGTENLAAQDPGGVTRRIQVTDVTGYTDVALQPLKADGSRAPTADLPMGGKRLRGLGAPTIAGDGVGMGSSLSTLVWTQAGSALVRDPSKKLGEIEVSITDHGGVGDYNVATGAGTDNTPAFLEAIAALGARGGRITIPAGFLGLIATSFRLPEGFSIVCKSPMVGINNGSLIPNYGAALYIDPAVSITIASGTRLSVNLLRRGLQFTITSAQVAATFTGIAVLLEDYSADHVFENMMVLGFGVGVRSTTITGTTTTTSRTRFIGVVGMDNQSDVHIHNAADVPYLYGIHAYVFVTDRSPAEANGAQLKRTGPSIWLSGLNDWTKIMVPFNYGRALGYRFSDCSDVKVFGAGADYPYQTAADGSIGFQFDGATRETTMFGCQCAQHDTGVYIASTANEHALTMIGCDFWENRINAVGVNIGQVQKIGGRIRSSFPGANGTRPQRHPARFAPSASTSGI